MEIITDIKDKKRILDFLKEVDSLFITPLSQQVNIDEYVDKVIKNGDVTAITDDGQIASLCMFYHNDKKTMRAFITLFVTKKEFQGSGASKKLMDSVCLSSARSGMKEIALETEKENLAAQRFYKKNGFEVMRSDYKIFMLKKL